MRSPDALKRGAASSPPGSSLQVPPPSKKQRRLGTRGAGFSAQEIDALLRLLREKLPLTKDEWDDVARTHDERFPELERTVDALRRKFARLHRMRAEDGDVANLPRDAQAAKAVLEAISRRADATHDDDGGYAELLGRNDGNDSDENTELASNDGSHRADPQVSATAAVVEPIRPLEVPQASAQARAGCQHCGQQMARAKYDDVMDLLRVSLLQQQQQREQDAADRRRREEQERARWEEERRRRDEDRAADRERMTSLLAIVAQSHQSVEKLVLALVKSSSTNGSNSAT